MKSKMIRFQGKTIYTQVCNAIILSESDSTRLQSENCDWMDPGYGQTKRFILERISQQGKKVMQICSRNEILCFFLLIL